jgi:hypothetical protein
MKCEYCRRSDAEPRKSCRGCGYIQPELNEHQPVHPSWWGPGGVPPEQYDMTSGSAVLDDLVNWRKS